MIDKDILKSCCNEGFNEKDLYGAYKIFFRTLVSEPRLKIVNLLRNKSMNVTEIIKTLKMNQTAVSHDLARLKKCGFVKSEIKGKFHYYKLNETTINPIMNLIDKHMSNNCIHILRSNKNKSKRNEK